MRDRESIENKIFATTSTLKQYGIVSMALGFTLALLLIITCAFSSAMRPLQPFVASQDMVLATNCDLDLEQDKYALDNSISNILPKLRKGRALNKSELEGLISLYRQSGHNVQYLYSDGMFTERWSKRFYAQSLKVLSKQKRLLAKSLEANQKQNDQQGADVWIVRSEIEKFERSKFAVIPPVSTRSLGTVVPLDNPGVYIYVKELVLLPVIDSKHSRNEFLCFEVERYIPVQNSKADASDLYQGLDGSMHCVPD